ncbi:hypothetical protein Patl1_21246 [Pistacia atlantica]|uniref:Uncharacterized protein n=1 Tax=Pistacia atlantica TaxID=434234 RepID=A0ACC1BIY9_9ROSI|nr:hypothetical protein Patl1_21246 [Pistacia atlantica]
MSEAVHWDAVVTHEFLVLLADRAKTSHGASIKTSEYKIISDKLWTKIRKKIEVDQLSSKYFRLRAVYNSWRALLQHRGFSWDHESQTPTCSKDIWQDYLKQNPRAKNFLHKGLIDKELYEVIFNKQNATVNLAYTSASQALDSNICFRDTVAVNIDEVELKPDPDRLSGEKRSNMSEHGRCIDRKKTSVHEDPLLASIEKSTEVITNRNKAYMAAYRSNAQENTSASTDLYSMANWQHMLTSMELDFKIFIGAVKFLVDKPAWHEIFVNMTPEQRTAWVHHDFDNENAQENTSAVTDLYSMANCQHILTSMELDFKIFIGAVKFLVDKPAWREIFVNMTPEQRTAWVHHDFDA